MKDDLVKLGFCKFENAISQEWVGKINNALPKIFEEHEKMRRENNNPISSNGLAMNALVGNEILFDFLQHIIDLKILDWIEENYFNAKCILNSFTALSNIPGEDKVFHKKVHRDIRGFSSDVPLMLNMLVMLDDFTTENGATLLLPSSHQNSEVPSDEDFMKNSVQATGVAGDIIIWNSNLFHASGTNTTQTVRRGLPITFSLPFYKQLLDYPRAIGYEKYDVFNEKMRRILGYDARVPGSVSEWYSPSDKLLYKN
ncbi:phytanoyl-CoA dioxygenase family protein [Chryseobacterium wangxinyae]|uniref:phytanoyl-CoA dioxygenase family protein n=1 Tax=Chryseobacterium sp. CY353 TaxID=2997334 RepID=UPI00226F5DAA|nr:phytanoyl-CoA dioxygenase family protein [Chryseobacterium sp. CY353]MCY0970994.1 phytanoyl-CoA dioxygenase family protein [Chryseobacterium sp. CY353]